MNQYTEKDMTPFFPADMKPERFGVYNTRCDWGSGYSLWNGFRWGSQYTYPENAEKYGEETAGHQEKEWRGLSFDPSKEAK